MPLFALSLWSLLSAAVCAVRITHDDKGVSFFHDIYEPMNASLSRRLISSSECASTGGYSGKCIATKPDGCGCAALTASEKQEILDLHNARRDMAAGGIEDCALDSSTGEGAVKCPAATDMNYLFWDPALETLSTFWAHQCIWDHHSSWDDPRKAGAHYLSWYTKQSVLDNTPPEAMYADQCEDGNCKAHGFTADSRTGSEWIGENIAASSGNAYSMQHIESAIHGWYDESVDYVWSTGETRQGGDQIGHWTQGVWAKTRYLGCGYAICPGGASGPFGDRTGWINFVCKYYPGGNYNGAEPYTAATSSSNSGGGGSSGGRGSGRSGTRSLQATTSKCSECESDRQGCVSSVTPYAAAQNALCGGPQCSACAVDYNQQSCDYGFASCPSDVFKNDGTVGPAMQPTSRPVAFTGEPTLPPTKPTPKPVPSPTADETCPMVSTGFGDSRYNGDWTYVGEYDGKAFYQMGKYYLSYSDWCGEYMLIDDYESTLAYCRCGAKVLSECTWNCWDGIQELAKTVGDCGSSGAKETPAPTPRTRTRSVSTAKVGSRVKLVPDVVSLAQVGGVEKVEPQFRARAARDMVPPPGPDPVLITINLESVSLRQALVVAVVLMFTVATVVMGRRAGVCGKATYSKVQMLEDSEEATQTEAEQILHVSN